MNREMKTVNLRNKQKQCQDENGQNMNHFRLRSGVIDSDLRYWAKNMPTTVFIKHLFEIKPLSFHLPSALSRQNSNAVFSLVCLLKRRKALVSTEQ